MPLSFGLVDKGIDDAYQRIILFVGQPVRVALAHLVQNNHSRRLSTFRLALIDVAGAPHLG